MLTVLYVPHEQNEFFKGVPFLFGVFPVFLAIMVACCIKETEPMKINHSRRNSEELSSSTSTAMTLPLIEHGNLHDTLHQSPDTNAPVFVELTRQSLL